MYLGVFVGTNAGVVKRLSQKSPKLLFQVRVLTPVLKKSRLVLGLVFLSAKFWKRGVRNLILIVFIRKR